MKDVEFRAYLAERFPQERLSSLIEQALTVGLVKASIYPSPDVVKVCSREAASKILDWLVPDIQTEQVTVTDKRTK